MVLFSFAVKRKKQRNLFTHKSKNDILFLNTDLFGDPKDRGVTDSTWRAASVII